MNACAWLTVIFVVFFVGKPEDIGNAVLFLASEEASFVTGLEIIVDGGQTRPEMLV